MNRERLTARGIWTRAGIAIAIATVANVLVAYAGGLLVSASPTFLALTPGPVAFVTIAAMAMGTLVYAILHRFTTHPDRWFTVIAVMVAAGSLAAPIVLALDPGQAPARLGDASTASALALLPLHLIPAAALLIGLRWRRRPA